MAFLSPDQRELFLPLIEGIHESPPWGAFMRNLVARTYARRAFLIVTLANAMPAQEPTVLHVAAPRAAQEPPIDFRRLDALRLHPYGALRPGRVYALDEMLDYDHPARLAEQRAALHDMGIRYGRWLRVSAGGAADAWLLLVREREDFSATAVSALAVIAPHLTAALRTLGALTEQRLQAAMAQAALARLGVGQLAFDAGGRVMAADPWAEALLAFTPEPGPAPGRRLQVLPDVARSLDAACAALAAGPAGGTRVIRLDERSALDVLLRKSDLALAEPCAFPAVIGTLRREHREAAREAVRTLAAVHGLSDREAALAHAISMGETIVEAGRRLRLTSETARNYSKRIYAKTGAAGQADLVRMVLTGLAPFT
ncbi:MULTISPECIES: LuxR family transcriptional regulator [unclassified Novosphingobium]|uniref:LuxR family transcriptional regulator n=1 Tax=unclassified Novosphingobium TaxID=2644732 RepID=UPI000F5E2DA7|nr:MULTISPECIES: LuxR family transcriptional regulator [unclassified Novosphingobium]MBF5092611.1 LuxR family transcriptional regulator [Novosphingobium sp. NBM11]RQW40618.1 LuxR family transcriptional regulator [Novosphingobium sp. LASN5T]